MVESAQQLKKPNSYYYSISHQWFRVAYIIFVLFAEHKFADISYKGTSCQPFHWISTKKKKKKEKNNQNIFASIY